MTLFFCAQVRRIRTFPVLLRTPVSHSCAQGRSIRDYVITRSPPRPLLLCAGPLDTHFSSFFTYPCFSFLCARALNTRLYVRLCYNASERPGLPALSFCAQGRSIRTFRLFGLLWAPLAAPKLPTWSLLGSAGCPKLLPWTTRVAHLVPSRSHRVLYVTTLGAITASPDDPSRSSGSFPGHRVL